MKFKWIYLQRGGGPPPSNRLYYTLLEGVRMGIADGGIIGPFISRLPPSLNLWEEEEEEGGREGCALR